MEALNTFILRLESLTRKLVIVIMLLMVCTVLLDVVARNTALRIRGLDEVARILLVWLVFLVTAVGARYGDLIGMTSFADALPPRPRRIAWVLRRCIFLVFLAFFGWYAFGLVDLMLTTGRTSPNLHVPLWFVYAPLLVGTVLMFLSLVADLAIRIKRGTVEAGAETHPGDTPWN